MSIKYPNRIKEEAGYDTDRKFREVIDALNPLPDQIAAVVQRVSGLKILTIPEIQKALTLGGSNPVNVTGLQGILANPQSSATIGTHAQRLITSPVVGSFFVETDRTSIYVGEQVGSAAVVWTFVAGMMSGTFASRPSGLTTTDVGFLFYANGDTPSYNTVFRWDGTKWAVEYGVMRGTLSPNQKPTLSADDFGFLFYATDFDRTYRWSGTVWLDYNSDGRGIFMCYEAPTTAGWQLADGSTVTRSKSDGTTTSITVPDLTSAANKYAYFKTNSAYSSVVVAATAPLLTMNSYTPAGTNSVPTLTMNSYTPSGTVTAPTFTGSAATLTGSVAAPTFSGTPFSSIINHTHPVSSILTVQGGTTAATTGTHVMTSTATGGAARQVTAGDSIASTDSNPVGGVASITPAGTNSAPALTMNAYTPAGTNSAPTFSGNSATLTGSVTAPVFSGTSATLTGTIGTTGEPQHLNVLPYFRL